MEPRQLVTFSMRLLFLFVFLESVKPKLGVDEDSCCQVHLSWAVQIYFAEHSKVYKRSLFVEFVPSGWSQTSRNAQSRLLLLSCVCCNCIGVQSLWDVIGSHHEIWTVVKLKWLHGSPTRSPSRDKWRRFVRLLHLPPPGDWELFLRRWMANCIFQAPMVVLGFSFNPCGWIWPIRATWCRRLNKTHKL